jgi:hypothetical protein
VAGQQRTDTQHLARHQRSVEVWLPTERQPLQVRTQDKQQVDGRRVFTSGTWLALRLCMNMLLYGRALFGICAHHIFDEFGLGTGGLMVCNGWLSIYSCEKNLMNLCSII